MLIPKTLKVGAFKVEVRQVKDLQDDGATVGENVIFINDGLSPQHKDLTLLHEIIHTINPAMSEKDVEWLSRALYQVFEDNHLLK